MLEVQESRAGRGAGGWRILVATDGSACAVHAQELLARIAFPAGTAIQVLAVAVDPFVSAGLYVDTGFATCQVSQELLDAETKFLSAATADAIRRLSRMGWEVSGDVRIGGICQQLLLAAGKTRSNLILVGTRGHSGLERLVLGSTAQSVARHAPCSVLVARGVGTELRRVLLAVDGSEPADRAVRLLARFPLPAGAEVRVAHVTRPYHPLVERLEAFPGGRTRFEPKIEAVRQQQREAAEHWVQAACRQLEAAGKRAAPVVLSGHPAEELLKLARREAVHLVVAGARGVSPVAGLLVGSVAETLLQSAPCSVLVAR